MMKRGQQELCPESEEIQLFGSRPSHNAIHTSSAYICDSPDEAEQRLFGDARGYAYQRDGHPNADALAVKCRKLHAADHAVVTSTGMSATALAVVSQLSCGDHVLLSHRLYNRTNVLIQTELARFGVTSDIVDMADAGKIKALAPANTRMLIAETISNPNLRVLDIAKLATLAHDLNSLFLVDNTFASPIVCRPLELGADLVVESLTKIMNGHGDVMMGLLCGKGDVWDRVPAALASWGMTAGPFDCWLVERGMATLFVRMSTASRNSKKISGELSKLDSIESVVYPGLEDHPDYQTAASQFSAYDKTTLFGNMIAITLRGGWEAAARFIQASREIAYCPSLGEVSTTLSHPASSSHRSLSKDQMQTLGMSDGTIRLSIGLESPEFIVQAVKEAVVGMDS